MKHTEHFHFVIWLSGQDKQANCLDYWKQLFESYTNDILVDYFIDISELEFEPDDYDVIVADNTDELDKSIIKKLTRSSHAKVILLSHQKNTKKVSSNCIRLCIDTFRNNISMFLHIGVSKGFWDLNLFNATDSFKMIYQMHYGGLLLELGSLDGYVESLDLLSNMKVLFVDDSIPDNVLESYPPRFYTTNNLSSALDQSKEIEFDLVFVDVEFKNDNRTGYEILKNLKSHTKVVMISEKDSYADCLSAWLNGATYYISQKNFTLDYFNSIVTMINLENAPVIISKSILMQNLWKMLNLCAHLADDILITGENGTGKELAAVAMYELGGGDKRYSRYEAHNCASIPETLFESEMFGHVKGSFTGAIYNKTGFLELADNGLLFLDEIGDMPIMQQAKLLRALQEKKFRPLGSTKDRIFNGKVVYATNKDLSQEIEAGNFRKDLYYRMLGAKIHIPALRDRKEDIEMLAAWFTFCFMKKNKIDVNNPFLLPPEELTKLEGYDFPGNIRELEKMIYQACINAMLNKTNQLIFDIPQAREDFIVAPSQEPYVVSSEHLCELLQNKIISSRGLSAKIKSDLIAFLLGKEYKISDIALLLDMSEQSLRNFKSITNSNKKP